MLCMFKDYDKYLSTSLKVYLFVLVIIFIMKMVGLDYFGITTDNVIINKIGNYLGNNHLGDVISFTTVYIQFYLYICIVCNKKKLYIPALIGSIINYSFQTLLMFYDKMDWLYYIMSFSIMIIVPMIINKNFKIKRQLIYIIVISIYQFISLTIRNVGVNNNYGNFLIDNILILDQLLMLCINYNIHFLKGGIKLCGVEQEVGYSSLKKINLKKSLKKLQKNWRNFKKDFKQLDKVTKLSNIIYLILSIFWNTFTIVTVFVVAFLNDTLIECIFIVTSFWLSKGKFGKPFHLKSMTHCFIVSNLTYYVLNRITTPLGISIIIPIMLGVGLSYVTSKLVKKTYKPLYRGMPEDLFEETILKVTDKDSEKYAICYDFYINKKSTVALSMKYNYSEAGIRKIKDRINNKIKEL